MRKSKFTPEQILQALRQAEEGTVVGEIRRKLGVGDCKSTSGAVRRFERLRESNAVKPSDEPAGNGPSLKPARKGPKEKPEPNPTDQRQHDGRCRQIGSGEVISPERVHKRLRHPARLRTGRRRGDLGPTASRILATFPSDDLAASSDACELCAPAPLVGWPASELWRLD